MPESSRLRPVFRVFLVLVVVTAIETLSCASLHLMEWRTPGSVVEIFLANHFANRVTTAKKEKILRKTFDRDLGWVVPPNFEKTSKASNGREWTYLTNESGARSGPGNVGALLVATYGDSFTVGVEVQNDETWQTYLAADLGGAVVNFGIAAYGTLQAVMRMERHLADGYVAPMTILGIYESNLERVVNSFRPLLLPESAAVLGFKPSQRYRNGSIEFFPSFWTDPDLSLRELEQLATEAAQKDFFAEQMGNSAFPFSYQVARMVKMRLIESPDTKQQQLWDSVEGRAIMNDLVDRFVAQVRTKGSEPVLLFIPSSATLFREIAPGYAGFAAEIRQRHPKMTVVDVAEQEFSRPEFNVGPFKGHPSPYGNRVIASALARDLRAFFADR
jgi:lysophospholipase L1-like esterase